MRLDNPKGIQAHMSSSKVEQVRKKTGGRTKGTPNKVTGLAKDAVAQVFDKIGGIEKMAEWAEDNPTQFYQIYAKLIPTQVNGAGEDGEHLVEHGITIKLVSASNGS